MDRLFFKWYLKGIRRDARSLTQIELHYWMGFFSKRDCTVLPLERLKWEVQFITLTFCPIVALIVGCSTYVERLLPSSARWILKAFHLSSILLSRVVDDIRKCVMGFIIYIATIYISFCSMVPLEYVVADLQQQPALKKF